MEKLIAEGHHGLVETASELLGILRESIELSRADTTQRAGVYFDEKGCVCRRDVGAGDAPPARIPLEDLNAENDE